MIIRVTSDLWVSALLRRVFSDGGYAAIVRRGATEAGAVFLVSRDNSGGMILFGPAPQTSYEEGEPTERQFTELLRTTEEPVLSARLDRETRFDADLWVVEFEIGTTSPQTYFPITTP